MLVADSRVCADCGYAPAHCGAWQASGRLHSLSTKATRRRHGWTAEVLNMLPSDSRAMHCAFLGNTDILSVACGSLLAPAASICCSILL